jgi:hypothetical protein
MPTICTVVMKIKSRDSNMSDDNQPSRANDKYEFLLFNFSSSDADDEFYGTPILLAAKEISPSLAHFFFDLTYPLLKPPCRPAA